MSFKKYAEYKEKIKTEFTIEDYKNKLKESLSSLAKRPNIVKMQELKDSIIDEIELSRLIEEVNYPHGEQLKSVLKTNVAKISEERRKLINYLEGYENKNNINSSLLFYESIIYLDKISTKELDKILESYCSRALSTISELASRIDDVKEKIKWHNYPISLEAIFPQKGFLLNEAMLKIGKIFTKKYIINLNSKEINELEDEQEVPQSLKEDSNNLTKNIFQELEKNQIAILYMSKPKSERIKLEEIKKQIVLGVKQFLPFNSNLFEQLVESNEDVWKVRIDLNKLKKVNDHYVALTDDVPIKWIERIS